MSGTPSQHIGWLKQFIAGMDESNWRDMKLRAERQLEELAADPSQGATAHALPRLKTPDIDDYPPWLMKAVKRELVEMMGLDFNFDDARSVLKTIDKAIADHSPARTPAGGETVSEQDLIKVVCEANGGECMCQGAEVYCGFDAAVARAILQKFDVRPK